MTSPVRFIESRENPDFRFWLRLAKGAAGRSEIPSVLLEGRHLCEAWCQHLGVPTTLIVAESLQAESWVQALWLDCAPVQRIVLQDTLAHLLSQVEHGPAVFCVVQPPRPLVPQKVDQTCLCLDRVQDPGNLGTLLRTAAAAGVRQAFLSTGCAQAWAPKVLRSGQGAHFALQIHEHVDLAKLIDGLVVPLAVTTLEQGSPLYDLDLREPCAWLFGNEGRGVAQEWLARAAVRVWIPQEPLVESLNVAAAAAICLFEQRRQQLSRSFDPGRLRP